MTASAPEDSSSDDASPEDASPEDASPEDASLSPGDVAPGDGGPVTGPQLRTDGPAPVTPPSGALVLGYRDTPLGEVTLRVGVDLAVRLNATLHVVHVVDLSDYPIDPDSSTWERDAHATLAAEQRTVEAALAGHPTSWSYHAARGNPVALLRQVADHHDALMFVVGSRGEGPGSIASRLLGAPSVSHGLIARSHRPVLVVPPRAVDPGGPGDDRASHRSRGRESRG